MNQKSRSPLIEISFTNEKSRTLNVEVIFLPYLGRNKEISMFYAYNSLTVPTINKPKSQPNSPKSKRRQPGVTPIPSPIPQRRLVEMGGEAREEPLQGDSNGIRQQKVNNF